VIAASGDAFRSSLAVPSSFRMSRSVELRPQRSCSVGAPGANTNTPGSLSPASPAGSSHQTVANGGSRALVPQRPRGRGERQLRFRGRRCWQHPGCADRSIRGGHEPAAHRRCRGVRWPVELAGLLAIALVAAIALRPPARSPASDSGSARLARVALVCMMSPAPGTDCSIRPRDDIGCHAQATTRCSCIGRNTTSAALAATQQDLVTHLADGSPGSVGNAPITAGPRC